MKDNDHIQSILNLNRQLTCMRKLEMREDLIDYINYLLVNDFNKLVQVLYRVDVNEQKLKELLRTDAQTDAAEIIANLLIQRQEEKFKNKEAFKSNRDISEEEKW